MIFFLVFGVSIGISIGLANIGFSQQLNNILDAGLGFSMPVSVLLYFILYKKFNLKEILNQLGLRRSGLSPKMIGIGLLIFLVIFLLDLAVSLVSSVLHTQINTNIGVLLGGSPLWFYIFAAVIEPINEEVLFRGFAVPRLGIVISALVFGLLHAGYNSTFGVEIIAAFIFGIIAGYAFKKTKSLYPPIIAHILVNSIAVIALL